MNGYLQIFLTNIKPFFRTQYIASLKHFPLFLFLFDDVTYNNDDVNNGECTGVDVRISFRKISNDEKKTLCSKIS